MRVTLLALALFVTSVPGLSFTKEEHPASKTLLSDLVPDGFGELSLAERRLLNAAMNGFTAQCKCLAEADREIRAKVFVWLCTNPEAAARVTHFGISVSDATFSEKLGLDWAKISFPIMLSHCAFAHGISLAHAHIYHLGLENSVVTEIDANKTHFDGDLDLEGVMVARGIDLKFSKIDGNLECDRGLFASNGNVAAIDLDSAVVKGSFFLREGITKGEVSFVIAKIHGNVEFNRSLLAGTDEVPAIEASGVEINGNVFLSDGFKSENGVDLHHAKIDGALQCNGEFVGNDRAAAINIGFAKIGRFLYCQGGLFIGTEKELALEANNVEVKNSVYLRSARNSSASVKDRFLAEGGVDLTNAKIDGQFSCEGGKFVGSEKVLALNANGVEVKGGVFVTNGFRAVGQVSFRTAKIDKDFQLQGGHFSSQMNPALDLRGAKAGTLVNTTKSGSRHGWPHDGFLLVDGLVYESISSITHPESDFQLGWIGLQPHERFQPQPFEQLAAVLRKMGLDEDARKVMIAKNEEHARYVQWRPEWLWYGPVGWLIEYGYDPWRPFWISLGLILIGWAVFRRGYARGLIAPTEETECVIWNYKIVPVSPVFKVYPKVSKACPKFNAFVYSLETFVPLVKLGIADHWGPSANAYFPKKGWPMTGEHLRGYLWWHMIAGWVLSALWVGGITGLVKT